jgi:hypothetical protein
MQNRAMSRGVVGPLASMWLLLVMSMPVLIGVGVQIAAGDEVEAGTDTVSKRRALDAKIAQLEQERRKMVASNGAVENRMLATNMAENVNEANGQYGAAKGKLKDALDIYNKFAKTAIQSRYALADAYETTDNEKVRVATERANKDDDAFKRAADSFKAREKQVDFESQKQVASWQASSHPSAAAEFKAYLDSRQDAAAAYAKLADGYLAANANPQDPSPDAIEDLKDNVTAAELAVALAQRKWVYAAEVGKDLESANHLLADNIVAKIEAMKAINAKTIEAIAEQTAAVMKLRKADRQRNKAAREIEDMLKSATAASTQK